MFTPAKTNRISTNIVDQIRKAILGGDLKPGDRLPPEKELAENFGVSKASLREAFRALEALGLLEVRQGMSGGAFVIEVDMETARNNLFNYIFFQNPAIHEFTELRALIEPAAAGSCFSTILNLVSSGSSSLTSRFGLRESSCSGGLPSAGSLGS